MVFRTIPALILLLGACDTGKSTGSGESSGESSESSGDTSDESTGESTGSSGADDSSTGAPAPDFGREGEPCKTLDIVAPCQAGGEAGIEFCYTKHIQDNGPVQEWSACLTEPCTDADTARPCDGGGQQYCVALTLKNTPPQRRWGVCNGPTACAPGDIYVCEVLGSPEVSCISDTQGGTYFEDCGFTPLVLSFGDALEFSPAPARAIDFSLRGADACPRADWPSAATPWLVLDRDANGSIDDGRELFGSGTMLASGSYAPHGFAALAELDADHDGQLSPADPSWPGLLLWADHDADRRSSGWELLPLASFDIEAIELGFHTTRDCDTRGNCGAERSAFRYRANGRARRGEVIDVHLRCE